MFTSNSCCCFVSPSGKLVQIEYALAAVASGAPSVGIKGLPLVIVTVVVFKVCSVIFDAVLSVL